MSGGPRRTVYDQPVNAELQSWPGVTAAREVRGKHYALVLTFKGRTAFVTYPASPSDAVRGPVKHLADVRATLRSLGAERTAPSRREGPRPRRQPPAAAAPTGRIITARVRGGRGPDRDPWEALKGLHANAEGRS